MCVAAFAALLWLGAWLVARHEEDDEEARTWLAKRGWRVASGRLWKMRHEDDEGWWNGTPYGKVRSHVAARARVERMEGQ
jgi:hypothetical protein